MSKSLFKRMRFLLAQDYFVKVDRFQFLKKCKTLNRKILSINNIFWSLRKRFLILTHTLKDVTDP